MKWGKIEGDRDQSVPRWLHREGTQELPLPVGDWLCARPDDQILVVKTSCLDMTVGGSGADDGGRGDTRSSHQVTVSVEVEVAKCV